MIIIVLTVLGLCLGSFVNALVWRLHEQSRGGKANRKLSITKGRSLCPDCRHELAPRDLVPVASWLVLGGRCRYCHKPIAVQYPLVELGTAILFVISYLWWPLPLQGAQIAVFGLWLILLVGMMALAVYDLRWFLLPSRLIYPLYGVALAQLVVIGAAASRPAWTVFNAALGAAVGGGLFYALFQVSNGKWIGGGDVRLGWLLGLIVGTPERGLLFIFIASLLGSLISLPLLAAGRLKRTSVVQFGPLLIIGVIVTQLFGGAILSWYRRALIGF